MSLDFLVKLRDAAQMIADAAEEELQKHAPADKPTYSLQNIKTEKAEGPSGFYEKATEQDSEDYRNLVADLKKHDGKLTKDGMFCWLFNDKKSIGMKPSTK